MNENTSNPLDQFLEMEDGFDPFEDSVPSAVPEPVNEGTKPQAAPVQEAEQIPTEENTPKPAEAVQTAMIEDAPDPFAAALAQARKSF